MDKTSNQDNIAEMVGLAGGEDTQGNTGYTGGGCGGVMIIIGNNRMDFYQKVFKRLHDWITYTIFAP